MILSCNKFFFTFDDVNTLCLVSNINKTLGSFIGFLSYIIFYIIITSVCDKSELSGPLKTVIDKEMETIYMGKSALQLNQEFLEQHSDSVPHRLAGILYCVNIQMNLLCIIRFIFCFVFCFFFNSCVIVMWVMSSSCSQICHLPRYRVSYKFSLNPDLFHQTLIFVLVINFYTANENCLHFLNFADTILWLILSTMGYQAAIQNNGGYKCRFQKESICIIWLLWFLFWYGLIPLLLRRKMKP